MPIVKKKNNAKKSRAKKRPKRKKSKKPVKAIKTKAIKTKAIKTKAIKTKKPRKKRKRKSNVLGGLKCVNQKQPFDCVVACLSMFLNKPYNYIKDEHFFDHDFSYTGNGITMNEEIKVLKSEGYNVSDISPVLPDRKAIVTVPSLNYPNSYHAVFWDGITICDPNSGKKKKDKNIKLYSHETFLNEPYKQPIVSTVS